MHKKIRKDMEFIVSIASTIALHNNISNGFSYVHSCMDSV